MAIIFDTYAWIEFFNGTEKGKIVRKYLNEEDILTPFIVLLELSYKAEKEGWNLKEHLNYIKTNSQIVGVNEKFILTFGKFYNTIRKKIKKIGITDVIILHTSILNDAKVLTGDKHFEKTGRAVLL